MSEFRCESLVLVGGEMGKGGGGILFQGTAERRR